MSTVPQNLLKLAGTKFETIGLPVGRRVSLLPNGKGEDGPPNGGTTGSEELSPALRARYRSLSTCFTRRGWSLVPMR